MKILRQACILALLVGLSLSARAADSDDEVDKLKVAVMDMRTSENIPKEMTATLTTVVSEELDKMGAFKSISSEDIKQMLGFERQKALLGCESETSCLAEIERSAGCRLPGGREHHAAGEGHDPVYLSACFDGGCRCHEEDAVIGGCPTKCDSLIATGGWSCARLS